MDEVEGTGYIAAIDGHLPIHEADLIRIRRPSLRRGAHDQTKLQDRLQITEGTNICIGVLQERIFDHSEEAEGKGTFVVAAELQLPERGRCVGSWQKVGKRWVYFRPGIHIDIHWFVAQRICSYSWTCGSEYDMGEQAILMEKIAH